MQCPECKADDSRVVWTKQLYSHTARGVECRSCHIVFETHETIKLPTLSPYPAMMPQPVTDEEADIAASIEAEQE